MGLRLEIESKRNVMAISILQHLCTDRYPRHVVIEIYGQSIDFRIQPRVDTQVDSICAMRVTII